MPSPTVPMVCGEYYHVYNRGVDKRDIFTDEKDYLRFYQSLDFFNNTKPITNFRLAESHRNDADIERLVAIRAYSLLPNHFHLLIEPLVDTGISEFMRRVSTGYTSYFNERHQRTGSLFQGKFKRVHVAADEYYNYVFAYVNENHFVHGLARSNDVYLSSSIHYQGIRRSRLILNNQDGGYSSKENIALAKEIYKRRANEKLMLHETE